MFGTIEKGIIRNQKENKGKKRRIILMAGKTNANIGFEKQLWDAACVLWGHIPAAEYRKVIIGLIFYKKVIRG